MLLQFYNNSNEYIKKIVALIFIISNIQDVPFYYKISYILMKKTNHGSLKQ